MDNKMIFIKILDERVADSLKTGGFSYVEEKINGDQTVFVFEESKELLAVLGELYKKENFQDPIVVKDSYLSF